MSLSILLDGAIVIIFLICVAAGMRQGMVKSVYHIFSFVVTLVLVVLLLHPFTEFMMGTQIGHSIQNSITQAVDHTAGEAVQNIDDMLEQLNLPQFLKKDIHQDYRDDAADDTAAPETGLSQWLSGTLARKIISVLGAAILFILLRIALGILFHALDAVFHLPILHGVNKLLGALLGAVNAAVVVYSLCAVAMLLSSVMDTAKLLAAIDKSLIARCFYEYNVLVNLFMINA